MFNFIKNSLKKIYAGITSRLGSLFATKSMSQETLDELKLILLSADAGVKTTNEVISVLQRKYEQGELAHGADLKQALREQLCSILAKQNRPEYDASRIFILVGINGSGKTTFAGKLAYRYARAGKRVLLVAGDTFRAAAVQQLKTWADRVGVDTVHGTPNQDPASVVFQGCQKFKEGSYDILIIDTAGRLHTKVNLMNELAKIKRVIHKQLPDEQIQTLLTIDSMLGQNSFEQATLFHESTTLNGLILTKMDGTGKGGIVFSITDTLQIPIWYVTFGESVDQLKLFDKEEYVDNLLTM